MADNRQGRDRRPHQGGPHHGGASRGGPHQGAPRQGGAGLGGANGPAAQANFHALLGVAGVEAANRGSATIDAEHLLLGLLFDRHGTGTTVLAEHGLTYRAFAEALEREREQTLAAVGVDMPDPARLTAAPRIRHGRPRFGASARDAWHRMGKERSAGRTRNHRWLDIDLLIGILGAELGTVPRALARGGFDRVRLREELRATRP